MSGFTAGQLGRLGEVQAPQYQGLGSLIAQSGTNPLGSLVSGVEQGTQQANANAAAQQQQQAQAIQIAQQKKAYIADTAFGITQLPEDKQQDAYNQSVIQMAKQGLIQPQDVQHWDQGGKEMTMQAAAQSPMAIQMAKVRLDQAKSVSDIQLNQAKTTAENIKSTQAGGGKPLSGADAKILEMSADASNQVTQLKNVYGQTTNPNISGLLPNAVQSDNVQQVQFLKNNLADMIGHLRAGARINDEQQQKFLSFLPKTGDSDATAAFKLDSLKSGLDNISASIRPVGNITPGADRMDSGYSAAAQSYPGLTQAQYKALTLGK